MQGTMIIIPVSGPEVRIALKSAPEVEAMQEAVGGWLELVPHFDTLMTAAGGVVRCVALCNEEGKIARPQVLPFNPRASLLWDAALKRERAYGIGGDYLAGTVVILTGDAEFMDAL